MNILHILSSTFFAGSVAYALALTEKQLAENHQVILISDTENLGDNLVENRRTTNTTWLVTNNATLGLLLFIGWF